MPMIMRNRAQPIGILAHWHIGKLFKTILQRAYQRCHPCIRGGLYQLSARLVFYSITALCPLRLC